MNPPDPTAIPERLFSGQIGAEYELLKIICPAATDMSWRVGTTLATESASRGASQTPLQVLELGTGTGITTLSVLTQNPGIRLQGLDNEPVMLDQARETLKDQLANGQLTLEQTDALGGLKALTDASLDAVVSAYTLHNFLDGYRLAVLSEIYRTLKPGGVFINGDRYALDDSLQHTAMTQEEVRGYFERLMAIQRPDVLEKWVVHLFSDESPDHIMRFQAAIDFMNRLGFHVEAPYRNGVNSLIIARKPL